MTSKPYPRETLSRFRRTSMAAGAVVLIAGLAGAQTLNELPPQVTMAPPADGASDQTAAVTTILEAAKAGDGSRIRAAMDSQSGPLVRKIGLWAMADAAPDYLTWPEADQARRELKDWPRPSRREVAAEKLLDRSSMAPRAVIAWFDREDPQTAQGAMALADALRADGQPQPAALIIRKAWRTMAFDQATQQTMLYRFHDVLKQPDIEAREDFLLYGGQDAAATDLLPQLPADQQAVANVRMALRRNDPNAPAMLAALPAGDQTSPGVVYEQLLPLVERGEIGGVMALVGYMPDELPNQAAAEKLWEKGALFKTVFRAGDYNGAYAIASHSGLVSGPEAAEARFDAGWLALAKLRQPKLAEEEFAKLEAAGGSPITQARALYWRGRVADAEGDPLAAQIYYSQAAKNSTTFYGQLAATRGGSANLVLGQDPQVDADARAKFESRDWVKAARLLYQVSPREGFRTFVAALAESVPSDADEAMLVDLTRGVGDQELSMRVVRNAARRGFILPERGYPIRVSASGVGMAEQPLVLGVTRQESSFDPMARSGAGARGMMQLMPATAAIVARRAGLGEGNLEDPDYNMKVGSTFLGQLVDQFSGSYVMATAAYNAGPGRPTQWTLTCGDPRSSSTDPLDFIECIPFSETKDYVMRVLEATQVYRARLNGGAAPITLEADLKRGAYGYAAHPATALNATPGFTPPAR
jgi:soluble lytic murein transglycosylase